MNLAINSKVISFFWWLFAPLLTALLFNSLVIWFIKNRCVEDLKPNHTVGKYFKDIPKLIPYNKPIYKKPAPKQNIQIQKLGNIELKACYRDENQAFIVFEEDGKTLFLNIEQSYKNAKLKKIGLDYALFVKNSKEIRVELSESKTKNNIRIKTRQIAKTKEKSYVDVDRGEFTKYTKNIKHALRDIRVQAVVKDKEFMGLKINFVRRLSLFDKMGLKKGDIIKTVDGYELKSIMDLLPYYNRLSETTAIRVGFERDKKMKEITYEIN